MRITREQDTKTLRYDWFINEDGTDCEVHEAYLDEGGLFEHNQHVMAAAILFRTFALDHRMTALGGGLQQLRDLAARHAGGIAVYLFPPGPGDGSSRLGGRRRRDYRLGLGGEGQQLAVVVAHLGLHGDGRVLR